MPTSKPPRKKGYSPSNKHPNVKVTVWEMLRDVLVTSMYKGQSILFLVFLVIVIFLARLTSDNLYEVASSIIDLTTFHSPIGYLLWVVTIFAWFYSGKKQRIRFANELKRITKERDDCQKKLGGRNYKSSNNG